MPPYAVFGVAVITQRLQYRCFTVDLPYLAVKRSFTIVRLKVNKLIDQQRRNDRTGNPVESGAQAVLVFLPGFHALAVLVPEIIR